ncbi:hypothetical protein C7120_00615 [Prevotella sp. oral taxon 376]|uniref:thioredoxin family protein n=1 Tax=Prevotella sp. oral taxon 376 TaxID=712466 RepID=UPI000D1F753A|nr:thioredoxin family protein [Prevotella sp. oral taxon 376]PTL33174.1 hypothetical protein C7120_00615 [Prevotella sp. oral taxon 376]
MTRMKWIGTLLIWCCFSSVVQAQPSQGVNFHDNESWSSILKLASDQDKLIFVDCYTTWCGPCKALAKEVFPLKAVGDYFNEHFINVRYDMEKGDGKMLHDRYKKNIIGFPTLLFIDKTGKVVQQMAGFQDVEKLIAGAKKAFTGRDLFTLDKEYRQGNRDFKFLCEYMASLEGAFLKDSAAHVAQEYLAKARPEELDKDEIWKAFGSYVTDVDSPAFEYLVNNIARYGYKLNRDRFRIARQLEASCTRELKRIFDIKYDEENGKFLPLSTDTIRAEKLVGFMSRASLPGLDDYRMRLYVHKLLLKDQLGKAWDAILVGMNAQMTGFYALNVEKYIRYMASRTGDKKVLKSYLAVLNRFLNTPKEANFAFEMYKTMAEINEKLGNKQLAKEQMERYQQENEKARKAVESFFKRG